jgi:hypothetical protein
MAIPRTKFWAVTVKVRGEVLVYLMGGKKFDGSRTNSIEVFNLNSEGIS